MRYRPEQATAEGRIIYIQESVSRRQIRDQQPMDNDQQHRLGFAIRLGDGHFRYFHGLPPTVGMTDCIINGQDADVIC